MCILINNFNIMLYVCLIVLEQNHDSETRITFLEMSF